MTRRGSAPATPVVPSGVTPALSRLAGLFGQLPGVGEKTALKFALHVATIAPAVGRCLGESLVALQEQIAICSMCRALAPRPDGPLHRPAVCAICQDPGRDVRLLCIVERMQDMLAIERSGAMRGRYLVLGQVLDPLGGVGMDDLPMAELYARIEEGEVTEVLLALPVSVEGEATAAAIGAAVRALPGALPDLKVSRIARGISHGADLEYADEITMGAAIKDRAVMAP